MRCPGKSAAGESMMASPMAVPPATRTRSIAAEHVDAMQRRRLHQLRTVGGIGDDADVHRRGRASTSALPPPARRVAGSARCREQRTNEPGAGEHQIASVLFHDDAALPAGHPIDEARELAVELGICNVSVVVRCSFISIWSDSRAGVSRMPAVTCSDCETRLATLGNKYFEDRRGSQGRYMPTKARNSALIGELSSGP